MKNAGAGGTGAVADVAPAEWRAALELNLTGAFLVLRATLPVLRAAGGGTVVNVSSVRRPAGGPGCRALCDREAGRSRSAIGVRTQPGATALTRTARAGSWCCRP